MAVIMGQSFEMEVKVTQKKGGKRAQGSMTMTVPQDLDGIIINLPAILGGAGKDVYMEEFIPAVVEEESEEVIVTDEFEMPMDG